MISIKKMEVEILLEDLVSHLSGVDAKAIRNKFTMSKKENMSRDEVTNLLSEICVSLMTKHYNYGVVATRVIVKNLHENVKKSFTETIELLQNKLGILDDEFYRICMENRNILDKTIDRTRDYDLDYFGLKTLEKSYLQKINDEIVEIPQYMFMRVAVCIHKYDIESVIRVYNDMSCKYYIHATPTLFNAGMKYQQLSSCYLVAMKNDSIDGIYETLKECAQISKWAGGIGLHVHQIRGKNSRIHSNNGKSDGIVPMLRVFNDTARYCNQCFTPNTIVYSKFGPKKMKDITRNDELVTIDGSFKKVQAIKISNVDKEIIEICSKFGFETINVTPEHEIYTIRMQSKITNFSEIKNKLYNNIIKPEFTLAKDLSIHDLVGYPIPTFIQDIEVTKDFCRFYGIMLGEGSIKKNSDKTLEYTINLNTTTKNKTALFVKEYLDKAKIHYKIINANNENNHLIKWSNELMGINEDDLYIEGEKNISSRFLHMPKEKTLSLVRGILETNCFLDKEIYFSSTSYYLVLCLRYLLLRLGILSSGSLTSKKYSISILKDETTLIKNIYTLIIPKSKLFSSFYSSEYQPSEHMNYFEWNSILWSKVKKITTTTYKGDVYDFNMIDNHNYTVSSLGLVHNSGKRSGSFAIYLEPWHCDIESFLDLKKNNGSEDERARDLFYALWIPDLFMKQVEKGLDWYLMCPNESKGLSDVYGDHFEKLYWQYVREGKYRKKISARELWKEILISQIETGTPYMLYKDSANRKSNQQHLGTIKSSNLCVAPETLLLTDNGHVEIQKIVNKKVNVWNGEEFSEVEIKQTGKNQKLIEVETDDGSKLNCTEYHKFYIQNKDLSSKILIKPAKNLQVNDTIIQCSYPIIDNKREIVDAYTLGFFCGDKSSTILEQTKLYGEITNNESKTQYGDTTNLETLVEIPEKKFVPFDFSLKSKLDWLAGYCDSDGNFSNDRKDLEIGSNNREFLLQVKLMLQTCGINPNIESSGEKEIIGLWNNLNDDKKHENRPTYLLVIKSIDLNSLIHLGFCTKRLNIGIDEQPIKNYFNLVKIKKVSDNHRIDDTYCFTEPKKNRGIFNGIITGQCTEIIEYSNAEETAVCNLASIGLPKYINESYYNKGLDDKFNHELLGKKVRQIVRNLNSVIDINYYPTENCKRSNMRHRPIGLGVQGLADVFMELGLDWETVEAKVLNRTIFETIYYYSVSESCNISKERKWMIIKYYNELLEALEKRGDEFYKCGAFYIHKYEFPKIKERFHSADRFNQLGAYSSFEGSPISQGKFQFDLWDTDTNHSGRYDWETLKSNIYKYGIRNSLLVAPMPTASTSQILGFNECIEPITSNIYSRRTMAGEFIVVNKRLMNKLIELGLWNDEIKNTIIENDGSIQEIPSLPKNLKDIYKTTWEIKQKTLIEMSADRGRYICQSQSLNLFLSKIDMNRLGSMHFYSWKQGLKTGIYYLRIKTIANTQKFTIEIKTKKEDQIVDGVCRKEEGCIVCSS